MDMRKRLVNFLHFTDEKWKFNVMTCLAQKSYSK